MLDFLKRMLGIKKNPTAEWMRYDGLKLVLDFDNCAFCGVRPGERFDKLSSLGPSDKCDFFNSFSSHCYLKYGIDLWEENNVLDDIFINITVDEADDVLPYSGEFIYLQHDLELNSETTGHDLVKIFGEPDEFDEDCLSYYRDEKTYCISFDLSLESLDGNLIEISISYEGEQ